MNPLTFISRQGATPELLAQAIARSIRDELARKSLPERFLLFFGEHIPEVCRSAVFDRPRPALP